MKLSRFQGQKESTVNEPDTYHLSLNYEDVLNFRLNASKNNSNFKIVAMPYGFEDTIENI